MRRRGREGFVDCNLRALFESIEQAPLRRGDLQPIRLMVPSATRRRVNGEGP